MQQWSGACEQFGSVSAGIIKPASGYPVAVYSGDSTANGVGVAIVLFGKLSESSDLAPSAARQLCELSKFLHQVKSVGESLPLNRSRCAVSGYPFCGEASPQRPSKMSGAGDALCPARLTARS